MLITPESCEVYGPQVLSSVDFDVVLNEVCQVPEGSLDEGYLGVEI